MKAEHVETMWTAARLGGVSILQIINVIGFIIFLVLASLGGSGRLGRPIGTVSNALPTLLTPAGWAFSIWSAIYALTGGLTIAQAFPSRRVWSSEKLGWWWAANTVIGQGLWTFAWVNEWGGMWVSALLLAFIVATLAGLYVRIDAGVAPLSHLPLAPGAGRCARALHAQRPPRSAFVDGVLLEGGIGLYLGWTTAATILNVSIALVASGVASSGEAAVSTAAVATSIAVLCVAVALAITGAVLRTDFWFASALAWACAGIRSQQMNDAWTVRDQSVGTAATVAVAIAGAAAAAALLWRVYLWRIGALPYTLRLGGGSAGADTNTNKGGAMPVVTPNPFAHSAMRATQTWE